MYESDDLLALPDDDVLFEGVPPHLSGPLKDWLRGNLTYDEDLSRAIALRLRMQKFGATYSASLYDARTTDLIRVTNALLQMADWEDYELDVDDLNEILEQGGSAYRVDVENECLIRRVSDEAQEAKKIAAKSSPASAQYLEEAWVATYGIDPDYDKAVSAAIKAVESALTPLVSSANPQPTLTKSLSTLRKEASDWKVALPDLPKGPPALEILVNLMHSIMRAHSSRHPGPAARIPYAVEAESVVHLAVAIVQMLSLGGLQKVEPTA